MTPCHNPAGMLFGIGSQPEVELLHIEIDALREKTEIEIDGLREQIEVYERMVDLQKAQLDEINEVIGEPE